MVHCAAMDGPLAPFSVQLCGAGGHGRRLQIGPRCSGWRDTNAGIGSDFVAAVAPRAALPRCRALATLVVAGTFVAALAVLRGGALLALASPPLPLQPQHSSASWVPPRLASRASPSAKTARLAAERTDHQRPRGRRRPRLPGDRSPGQEPRQTSVFEARDRVLRASKDTNPGKLAEAIAQHCKEKGEVAVSYAGEVAAMKAAVAAAYATQDTGARLVAWPPRSQTVNDFTSYSFTMAWVEESSTLRAAVAEKLRVAPGKATQTGKLAAVLASELKDVGWVDVVAPEKSSYTVDQVLKALSLAVVYLKRDGRVDPQVRISYGLEQRTNPGYRTPYVSLVLHCQLLAA